LCILALGDFPYFIALVAGGLGISPSWFQIVFFCKLFWIFNFG
jgi:hypothetical protein